MTIPVVSSSTLAVGECAGFAGVVARLGVPSAPTGSVSWYMFAGNYTADDDKGIRSDTPETSGSALGETTLAAPIRLHNAPAVGDNGSLNPKLTHPIIARPVAAFAMATIDVARKQPAST